MRHLLYIIILLSLLSCKRNENITYLDLFDKQIEVTLHPFNETICDSLMSPSILFATDNYLVFSEPKLPTLLSIYNFKDKTFKRFLSKGNGQNEAVDIQALGHLNHNDSFYAHDVMAQSIFLIEMSDSVVDISKDTFSLPYPICSLAYDDNLAFYMSIGDSTRFTVRNNDKISFLGDLPKVKGILPQVLSQSIQGPSLISSENKKIVWFSIYNDMMEIYDYSDVMNIHLEKSLVVNLPIYSRSAERNSGILDINSKLSVSSITADKEYIYALYNDNLLKDASERGTDLFYCKKILVFDWKGNPIKQLNIDQQIRSITYRKEDEKIYCLGLNENLNPMIYYFDTKGI